jgi:hypothetical protein
LVQKFSRIKLHKGLALPILLYGSELWTLRQKDKNRLTSIEMKIFRRTARYRLFGHKKNQEIVEEFKVEPVDDKLRG